MKHFVTADEIRQLAASGERELMLREHTVLTDAAVDAVRLHGIRLVEGSTYSTAEPPPQVVPAPAGAGGLPAPALAGLVRERSSTGVTPSPQARRAEGSGTVPVTGPPDSGRLLTRLLIGGEWVEVAPGRERGPRRADGLVDVLGLGRRHVGDRPVRGRVDGRHGRSAGRLDPLAAD